MNFCTLLPNTKKLCDFDFGIYRLHVSASLDPPDIYANLFVNLGDASLLITVYRMIDEVVFLSEEGATPYLYKHLLMASVY